MEVVDVTYRISLANCDRLHWFIMTIYLHQHVCNSLVLVDVLDSEDAAHLALMKRPELGVTLTKIHAWSLTQVRITCNYGHRHIHAQPSNVGALQD